MEITEVKVFPINEEKLKAFVSVVFDRCFMVNDIKIIHGRDGLFISMPSRKKKSGEFKDVAHPLNNDTRRMIETRVVAEYERVLAERGEELPAPPRPYPGEDGGDETPAQAPRAAAAAAAESRAASRDGAAPQGAAAATAGGGAEPSPRPAATPPPASGEAERPAAAAAPAASGEVPKDGEKGGEAGQEGKRDAEKTLEEVQEMHLRDSFWSVS